MEGGQGTREGSAVWSGLEDDFPVKAEVSVALSLAPRAAEGVVRYGGLNTRSVWMNSKIREVNMSSCVRIRL